MTGEFYMHLDEFKCQKCGNLARIEGDYPKYYAWCYHCNDYAEGFDPQEHAIDKIYDLDFD